MLHSVFPKLSTSTALGEDEWAWQQQIYTFS